MIWLLDTNALIKSHLLQKENIFKKDKTFTTIYSILEFPIAMKHEELTIVYPDDQTYERGLYLALKLRENGTPIPIIDLLNGVMAVEQDATLISDDSHFELLKAVEPALQVLFTDEFFKQIKDL